MVAEIPARSLTKDDSSSSVFFFPCPFCQENVKSNVEWIGRSASCPHCNSTIIVPNNQKVASKIQGINKYSGENPTATSTSPLLSSISCPNCNADYLVEASAKGKQITCNVCQLPFIIKTFNTPRGNSPIMPLAPQFSQINNGLQTYCQCCGKIIAQSAESCPHCGAINEFAVPRKSRIVYVLLGLFLGEIGAHNIYAKRWTAAAIQFFLSLFILISWIICTVSGAVGVASEDSESVVLSGVFMILAIILGVALPVWYIIEICTVEKDGDGIKFK